jgi:hypothetical protein
LRSAGSVTKGISGFVIRHGMVNTSAIKSTGHGLPLLMKWTHQLGVHGDPKAFL